MASNPTKLVAYSNVPFIRDGMLVYPDPGKPRQDPIRLEDTLPIDLTDAVLEAGFATQKGAVVISCTSAAPETGLSITDAPNGKWRWQIPQSKLSPYAGKEPLLYDLRIVKNGVPRRLWGGTLTVIRGFAGAP